MVGIPSGAWLDECRSLDQIVGVTLTPKVGRVTVGEVMTTPATTLAVQATVADARAMMLDSRGSALPIVNALHHPVGVLTNTDLVVAGNDTLPVAVLMTSEVLTCEAGTSVWAAARTMRTNNVHHLVVVDDGVTVGILSVFDLLQLLDDVEPKGSIGDRS
jgi:CBS domain-containing protein